MPIHLNKCKVIFPLKAVFDVWGGKALCTSVCNEHLRKRVQQL